MLNNTPGLGHNRGPFETTTQHLADLWDEAKNCLDGKPVTDKKQADMVVKLVRELRGAKTACDDARKEEVVYWNEGKAEVQGRYNPFLKMAKQAIDMAQTALAPWLLAQETAKREADARMATEAIKEKARANAAIQASSGDLAARQEAEYRLEDAIELENIAKKSAKENIAKGAQSRWDITLHDRIEAARFFWTECPEDFDELLMSMSRQLVAMGKHNIPGFTITERIVV